MNWILANIISPAGAFLRIKKNRRGLYLLTLSLFALIEYAGSGLSRKTFVFFSTLEGDTVVEERMLHRSSDPETNVRRYLDQVLLGAVSPGLNPLFPRDTRLNSFMLRDNVVYADLTESAILPPGGSGNVFLSLLTLNEGIRRNFSYVKDVKIFIGGYEVFFQEFSRIFTNSADNYKTSP